jgi:hypothetical protein
MERHAVGIRVGVLLLLLASVAAALLRPSAVEVARARCLADGWRAEDLGLRGYRGTGVLFGRREVVEFQVIGAAPPKTVLVELRKPVYFMGWQVVEVREEVQAGQQ